MNNGTGSVNTTPISKGDNVTIVNASGLYDEGITEGMICNVDSVHRLPDSACFVFIRSDKSSNLHLVDEKSITLN